MTNKDVFKTKSMSHGNFYMTPVDIIVPFHGEEAKVSRLIESVFRTVRTNRYKITLVDDASENIEFTGQFSKTPGIGSIRHETQRGFGAALNTGIAATKQPYILICHSDVIVEGLHWLSNLGETLMKMKKTGVKMVSPKTDNPLVFESVLGGEKNTGNKVLENGVYLPLYCALFHRELWKRVGKFKEYPYAGGEAEEYALRMNRMGYTQAVCGSSWVHHEGRGTLKKYDKSRKVQESLRSARCLIDADINSLKI